MVKNLPKLSIDCANKLFNIVLKPILTYAIKSFWYDLTARQIKMLDACQWMFYKRVLGLPINAKNRKIALLLNDIPSLAEQLVNSNIVSATEEYRIYITEVENKLCEVEQEFFTSPGMTQEQWKKAGYDKRHLILRACIHGFHHKLCSNKDKHELREGCKCKLCDETLTINHVFVCSSIGCLANVDNY